MQIQNVCFYKHSTCSHEGAIQKLRYYKKLFYISKCSTPWRWGIETVTRWWCRKWRKLCWSVWPIGRTSLLPLCSRGADSEFSAAASAPPGSRATRETLLAECCGLPAHARSHRGTLERVYSSAGTGNVLQVDNTVHVVTQDIYFFTGQVIISLQVESGILRFCPCYHNNVDCCCSLNVGM